MTTSDWLMVIAILLAPLFALQVQRIIDFLWDRKNRKMKIFEALMTTRKERVSNYHVQALNMIDINFDGMKFLWFKWRTNKEKKVLTAWKIYLDHLNVPGELNDIQLENWVNRGDDLFADLLFEMSHSVGYSFDKIHLKRSVYSPRAHGSQLLDNESIRQNLVKILNGEQPLPMRLVQTEEVVRKQNEIQSKFEEILNGERTIKIKIVENK